MTSPTAIPADLGCGRKPVRIFWFGAHHLLVNTELARLRQLGYEVFNPPYLSNVLDQSAVTSWDRGQHTTLPPDVFERLASYNLFYSTIDHDIGDILNEYFDAVIVTIVARWVMEILRVFNGPVLFRSYGQTSLLSDDLIRIGADSFVRSRNNFHFLPHAVETAELEEAWLQERMTIVPYCLSGEVFESRDTWRAIGRSDGDILISAPNILGNPFHRSHYDFLKEFFHQPYFRYMGVQPIGIEDPQVTGTLTRDEQLRLMRNAAGYLYTYRDSRVCYLPPVEMIVFGGPVIYLAGSLLSRYIGPGGPGEAETVLVAHQKCARLRDGREVTFIKEVTASQRQVADRYDPQLVWPVFDDVISELLPKNSAHQATGHTPITVFPDVSPYWRRLRTAVGAIVAELRDAHVTLETSPSEAIGPIEAGGDAICRLDGYLAELQLPAQRTTFADVVGRTDILGHSGSAGIGTWMYDPVLKRRARFAPAGAQGFLQHGPRIKLAMGRYEVVFTYRAETTARSWNEPVGKIDVFVNENRVVMAANMIPCGKALWVSGHIFEVNSPDDVHEFRVQSNGAANIYLHALTVQGVTPQAPDMADEIGSLVNGQRPEIGEWSMDPIFRRAAWFAPAGSAGNIYSGPPSKLDPGTYEATFVLRPASHTPFIVGTTEIRGSSGDSIFTQDFLGSGGFPQVIRKKFEVPSGSTQFQSLVSVTGIVGVYLFKVAIEAVVRHNNTHRRLC